MKKILSQDRFMRLIDGELVKTDVDKPVLTNTSNSNKKILYLKHPTWVEPDNKEKGIGGINAVGRVIYNHSRIKIMAVAARIKISESKK